MSFGISGAKHHGGDDVYNMTGVSQSAIFGTVSGDKPVVMLNLEIHCNICKKTVPGGVRVSKRHHGGDGFDAKLQSFMRRHGDD